MSLKNQKARSSESLASRIASTEEILTEAIKSVGGKSSLTSEMVVLTAMASKVAGLNNCPLGELVEIEADVNAVLQSIENYCEFMISVAGGAN